MSVFRLPAPPEARMLKDFEDVKAYLVAQQTWANDLVRNLELNLTQITQQAGVGYLPTNYTTKRDLDGSTAVLADAVNVLCTLIKDFKNVSKIG